MSPRSNLHNFQYIAAATIRQHWLTQGLAVWEATDVHILQRFQESNTFTVDNNDRLADLYHFALLMEGLGETEIATAATNLLSSLDNYILFNKAWSGNVIRDGQTYGWNHSNSYGVSIALPRNRMSFYTGDWLDLAQGANWQSSLSSMSIMSDENEWGPFVSELVMNYNPSSPDDPNPPDPISPMVQYQIYLPMITKY
jgi:hypothetical protein